MGLGKMTWKPNISKGHEPLTLSLVRAITTDVTNGTLKAGNRLPTQRELADDLQIAIGTVTRAFKEAERRGLIYGDGRRGTFVGEMPRGRRLLSSMSSAEITGIDLSKNHPAHAFDPDLGGALHRLAKDSYLQQFLQYPPAAGLHRHRATGAQWIRSLGYNVEAEQVFLCGGAQHALMVIIAAETRPGDTVAAEQYTYPGIKAITEMLGLELVGIPMDEDGIIPEAFEALCRKGKVRLLYCNPTFQNPTGRNFPQARRKRLVEIACKYELIIVNDEILSPFLDSPAESMAAMAPERSYFVISVSKSVAAGLRLGFIIPPPKSAQKLIDSLQTSNLGGPPLMAEIFSHWLESGIARQTIARRKRELAKFHRMASECLAGFDLRSDPACFHLWLHLPEKWTSANLAVELQRRGVLVSPAEVFAIDKKAPSDAIRLSIGAISDPEQFKRGLKIILETLTGSAPRRAVTV
jgi:DNA-binding transcriptional MocR family regulator